MKGAARFGSDGTWVFRSWICPGCKLRLESREAPRCPAPLADCDRDKRKRMILVIDARQPQTP